MEIVPCLEEEGTLPDGHPTQHSAGEIWSDPEYGASDGSNLRTDAVILGFF